MFFQRKSTVRCNRGEPASCSTRYGICCAWQQPNGSTAGKMFYNNFFKQHLNFLNMKLNLKHESDEFKNKHNLFLFLFLFSQQKLILQTQQLLNNKFIAEQQRMNLMMGRAGPLANTYVFCNKYFQQICHNLQNSCRKLTDARST